MNGRAPRFHGILDEQLAVTTLTIVDNDELESYLQDLDYLANRGLLTRIGRWLSFLNEPTFYSRETYSHLVYSVLIAAKYNEIFRKQTSHEFQVSLDLLGRILKRKPKLSLRKLRSAEYLLTACLVLGKYPGMVIGSINQAIDQIDEYGSIESLSAFFAQLFVKYENPEYLISHLPLLTQSEIESLMFVLQGNSLRKFPSLPMPLSRKESWVLQNQFPTTLRFEEDILLREIVCSKLLIDANGGEMLLEEFVESCKRFQFNLQTFIKDLPFWKQAFHLCCKIEWDEVDMSMTDFLDHIDYRRYVDENDFSLKGRTALSLQQELYDWNERQEYEELLKLLHLSWKGQGMKPRVFEHQGNEYQFGEIKNGHELQQESQNLKHCALSYIRHCANGHTSVWSLKRKEDAQFRSYITVEITAKGDVTQARGLCNRDLTRKEQVLVQLVLDNYDAPDEDGFDRVIGDGVSNSVD